MLAGPPGFGYARRSVTTPARIYMASPLGFSEAGRHFYGGVLIPFVRSLGFEVLDPWALADPGKIDAVKALPRGPAKRDAWRILNHEMGAANRKAIDSAAGIVAVLDGTDVDSGTATEIGRASCRERV